MNYDCHKGILIYSDRTGSYEGIEFVIEPDNESVLSAMEVYEGTFNKAYEGVKQTAKTGDIIKFNNGIGFDDNGNILYTNVKLHKDSLPSILPREIKQIKNEFYLIPNWQCGYCYYQGLSCKPNMSKNKIAEIKDDKLKIRKGYLEYED
ncbi:unnamed protein product, partial [marine sediment metagenome]